MSRSLGKKNHPPFSMAPNLNGPYESLKTAVIELIHHRKHKDDYEQVYDTYIYYYYFLLYILYIVYVFFSYFFIIYYVFILYNYMCTS